MPRSTLPTFSPAGVKKSQAKAQIKIPLSDPDKAQDFIKKVLNSKEVKELNVEGIEGTLKLY